MILHLCRETEEMDFSIRIVSINGNSYLQLAYCPRCKQRSVVPLGTVISNAITTDAELE